MGLKSIAVSTESKVDTLLARQPTPPVDLLPLTDRINALETKLTALQDQITSLTNAIGAISIGYQSVGAGVAVANQGITNLKDITLKKIGEKIEELHTTFDPTTYTEETNENNKQLLGKRISTFGEGIKEISDALEAPKYGAEGRIPTLGHLVERIACLLGYRIDEEGKVDYNKERGMYRARVVDNPSFPSDAYSTKCFGRIGRLIPYLPTTYNSKGEENNQRYHVVHDIPQMLEALHAEVDKSIGIQYGSSIRLRGLDGQIEAYPNQLALLIDLFGKVQKISYNTEMTHRITSVSGQEIRELFGGIGIPVSEKYLVQRDLSDNRKSLTIPYYGFQRSGTSVKQELTTLKINTAIVLGMLSPKKQGENPMNPFNWLPSKKEN